VNNIDITESRLLALRSSQNANEGGSQENRSQNSLDRSFEEKLKSEQARLGLMFSPFAQLNLFFSSPLAMNFVQSEPDNENTAERTFYQRSGLNLSKPPGSDETRFDQRLTPQIFESVSLRPLNKLIFQDMLNRANLLVPNLAAQPLFNQAFLAGRLQPKLDLQFLIDQILEQVKLVKGKGKTELSLTLKPENLGEIFLQLTSLAGKVSILISASPETRKLIDASKEELARALKKSRINLDRITIEEAKKNA